MTPAIAAATRCTILTANIGTFTLFLYCFDPNIWITAKMKKLADLLIDPEMTVNDFVIGFVFAISALTVAAAFAEQAQRPDFKAKAAPKILAGAATIAIFVSNIVGGVGTKTLRGIIARRLHNYGFFDAKDVAAALAFQGAEVATDWLWTLSMPMMISCLPTLGNLVTTLVGWLARRLTSFGP